MIFQGIQTIVAKKSFSFVIFQGWSGPPLDLRIIILNLDKFLFWYFVGLVSLEMELSTDPVLGEWKIKANDGFKEVEEPFKVDKYGKYIYMYLLFSSTEQ